MLLGTKKTIISTVRCFTVSFETSPIVSHGTCLLRCIIQIPFFLFSVLEKQEVQPHSSASGRYDSTVPFTAGWKKTGSWCGDGWIVQVRARIEHCSERHICWYHRYQLVSTTRRSQMLMLVDGIAFIKKKTDIGASWFEKPSFLTNESLACTVSQRNDCKTLQ